MPKVLKIKKSVTEGTKELLRTLLEKKKIRAVLTLREDTSSREVSYSLIADPDKLKEAVPFYPVMPNNAGKLLSRITLKESSKEPIAAVLRPCEIRAFVELVKRLKGSLDNIFVISSICTGVYPLKKIIRGELDKQLNNYLTVISKDEPAPEIRDTCRICEHFVPDGADIIVPLTGEKNANSECRLFINTEKGAELLEGIDGKPDKADLETEDITRIRSIRQKEKEKLFKETEELLSGLDGMIDVFETCISCHGCRSVCPVCYCQLCEFDSKRSEYKPEIYEIELLKRGGVRVPPGTLNFHLGRLSHMAVSCVGCGMCSDVCPADIPVSTIFTKTGESVQKMFDYIPGRDVEEDIPIATFEEQELSEVED